MVKATILVQRTFGFSFLAFGLNGFVHFIPRVGLHNGALEFFLGLAATGYMLPLLYMTQAAAGACLLVGFFVPLALAVLAPVVVNILLFHIFLAPAGIPLALMLVSFEVSLAWSYRHAFAPMLQPHTIPDQVEAAPAGPKVEPAHRPAIV